MNSADFFLYLEDQTVYYISNQTVSGLIEVNETRNCLVTDILLNIKEFIRKR